MLFKQLEYDNNEVKGNSYRDRRKRTWFNTPRNDRPKRQEDPQTFLQLLRNANVPTQPDVSGESSATPQNIPPAEEMFGKVSNVELMEAMYLEDKSDDAAENDEMIDVSNDPLEILPRELIRGCYWLKIFGDRTILLQSRAEA